MLEKAGAKTILYLWSSIRQYSSDTKSSRAQEVADRILRDDYSVSDFKDDFDIPTHIASSILTEVKARLREEDEKQG